MLSGLSGVQRKTRFHVRLVAVYKSPKRRDLLGVVVPSSTEDTCQSTVVENERNLRSNINVWVRGSRVLSLCCSIMCRRLLWFGRITFCMSHSLRREQLCGRKAEQQRVGVSHKTVCLLAITSWNMQLCVHLRNPSHAFISFDPRTVPRLTLLFKELFFQ